MSLLAAMTLALVGCAGGGHKTVGLTFAESSQPDSLDPALGYTVNALEPGWLVYTPLLTYRHAAGAAGARLQAGLADALPTISADGREYRLKLRSGLRYSDGAAVRAGDFKHAIARVLALKSPGSSFFAAIAGASAYVAKGRKDDSLPGIVTNDRTGEITIRLTHPDATFTNALAMVFAAPVPRDTPFENLTAKPPPGVGAYKYAEVHPGRGFTLERNDSFAVPGIPQAKVSPIEITIEKNRSRQAEDVLAGRVDYMQEAPPPDILPRVRREAGDRYREAPAPISVYFFLNHDAPPFDDPRVRQAAELAFDRPAAERLFGRLLEPACNVLPPAVPGSAPLDPCPWEAPDGGPDLARARELVDAAGARGAKVSVWAPRGAPADRIATVYADSLSRAGLDARPRLVDFAQYIQLVGSRRTHAQVGYVSFAEDYPHPADFLRPFSGSLIAPTGSGNFSFMDSAPLTASIDRLGQRSDLEADARRWAAIDHALVRGAHVVPVGFQKHTTFVSDDVDPGCVVDTPVFGNDYSSFCLK
jgi:peptide/nickel transport system substrate-binding protein